MHREKYAGNETYLQQMLPFLRIKKEDPTHKLVVVREQIRELEAEKKRIVQELDVIKEAIKTNNKGIITSSLSCIVGN